MKNNCVCCCIGHRIEESDIIIAYVYREFGGAYEALKYAEKSDKNIVNIAPR